MIFKTEVKVTEAFRDFIKHQKYEDYVLYIISHSKQFFAGQTFIRVFEQSNGEPDYIDQNGKKYEVKLLFDKQLGELLGQRKNQIDKWFEEMSRKTVVSPMKVRNTGIEYVKTTWLYKILTKRLSTIKDDEQPVFFIPYPIVQNMQGVSILQTVSDGLQIVVDAIIEEGLLGSRELYLIYPSMESGVYVLRKSDGAIEFVRADQLDSLFSYNLRNVEY